MTIPHRRRIAVLAGGITGRLPVVKPRAAHAPPEHPTDTAATTPRPASDPPLYARLLRLRNIHPGGLLCFLYFEGAIALAVLLALAELVPWTAIPILPVTVAVIVKINDLTTGGGPAKPGRTSRPARVPAAQGSTYPPPRIASALEAGPVRSTLYGTPVRPEPDPIGKPPRGALAPSAVYRSSAALSGQPSIDGPVPGARLEQQPYHVAGRAGTLRRGVPPGAVYHSTPR